MTELGSLISRIQWCGYLDGRRRDQHVTDIFDLLSNAELNSGQIEDLLEPLEMGLAEIPGSRYFIAPTELSMVILHSHQNHTKNTYQKGYHQRLVEEELMQQRNSAVASIAWIPIGRSGGHWISYVVDLATSTIFHGDSLGLPMPLDLCNALQWWLHDLQKRMRKPTTSPSFRLISITRQTDGFSCGILATNSLFHYIIPSRFPLISGDAT